LSETKAAPLACFGGFLMVYSMMRSKYRNRR
jgi:hypothetical protein